MSQNVLERKPRVRRRGDSNTFLSRTVRGGSQRLVAWAILAAFATLLGLALFWIS
jgi:hypothetical protein